MRLTEHSHHCSHCRAKCDIYFTAREMQIDHELEPFLARFRKHETISLQNNPINHAVVLLEGHAKMFIEGIYGRNIMIGLVVPGNYIGLMAVYGLSDYPYNVRAITECLCCQVDINFIKKMYSSNPSFQNSLNISFGNSVQTIMKKLISLNQKQLRARMAESLLYLSQIYDKDEFILTITRKDMGELAGITAENAVRVLSDFRQEGLIRLEGKKLALLRSDLLEKISEAG